MNSKLRHCFLFFTLGVFSFFQFKKCVNQKITSSGNLTKVRLQAQRAISPLIFFTFNTLEV